MSFAERWKAAGEPQGDDWDPPDGSYRTRILEARAFESKDGREFTKVTLQVLAGDHEGREFDDFNGLDHEVGARIARENLSVYGLNADAVEDFDDLAIQIGEIVGGEAEVVVSHSSKGYLNVKATNGRPAGTAADVEPDGTDFRPSAKAPADDDIPF